RQDRLEGEARWFYKIVKRVAQRHQQVHVRRPPAHRRLQQLPPPLPRDRPTVAQEGGEPWRLLQGGLPPRQLRTLRPVIGAAPVPPARGGRPPPRRSRPPPRPFSPAPTTRSRPATLRSPPPEAAPRPAASSTGTASGSAPNRLSAARVRAAATAGSGNWFSA